MIKYRPSFDFIVNATSEDLLLYVNQSYIKFIKLPVIKNLGGTSGFLVLLKF
jgi:hypothetical protein